MDLENQYYNSKALKEDDPKAALSSFQKVLCLYILSLLFILIHILKYLILFELFSEILIVGFIFQITNV